MVLVLGPHVPVALQVAPARSTALTSIFAQTLCWCASGSGATQTRRAYFKLAGKKTLVGGN